MPDSLLIQSLIVLAGSILAYSAFCRAVRMSAETLASIRWTMSLQGAGGLAVAVAVLLRPELFGQAVAFLALATASVQIATSRFWMVSTPLPFTRQAWQSVREGYLMHAWIAHAYTHIGQKEVPGPGVNAWIKSLWGSLKGGEWFWGQYGNDDSKLPWCGAFVAKCMQDSGFKIPERYASAKAWLEWGSPLSEPAVGAVVVFTRDGGGHVGFVVGADQRGRLMVLGGNQGDAVSIAPFELSRVAGYRWPPGTEIRPHTGAANLPVMASGAASNRNEA